MTAITRWLVPFRTFTIHTSLSPSEVRDSLRQHVGEARWFSTGGAAYCGSVSESHFSFQRNITYRNSFLPVVQGRIRAADHGATVTVRMRMNVLVIGFMLVWLGMAFAALVGMLATQPAMAPGPLGMCLFGGVLMNGAFGVEANKAERMLRGELPTPMITDACGDLA